VGPRSSSGTTGGRAWSYSQLSSFELCPRKWAAESFYKTLPFQENEAALDGKTTHKAFELYLTKGKPLPLNLRHHQENLDKIKNAVPGAEMTAEMKLAITERREPCDWMAPNVWCRSIADLMLFTSDFALIIDWKTGRVSPDYDQLDLMVAVAQTHVPGLKKAVGLFYWTKTKTVNKKTYGSFEDMLGVWEKFQPRVEHFQNAVEQQNFPAKRNFLCKAHCRVTGCQYHGMSQ
jgi:hypothetical protein